MKTKKGMASLYLVAFTTLLLGIVTMSFARVMISESREASNSDLSQSAFDSALAGVEDAKTAILKYEQCNNNPAAEGCGEIITRMKAAFDNHNCDVVRNILGNSGEGAVEISEDLNQSYTCVTIADDAPIYQSTLTEDIRSRVVPAGTIDNYQNVVGIELQWFTIDPTSDEVKFMNDDAGDNFIPLKAKSDAMDKSARKKSAPILTFELFQTDESFRMYQLDLNNETNTGTDHAMIMLYPESGDSDSFVTARNLLDASNKSSQAALTSSDYASNSVVPKLVSCFDHGDGGAYCRAVIQFPATYNGSADNTDGTYSTVKDSTKRAKQTFMFRVSLPYGAPQTDFSIKPCTEIVDGKCTETSRFTGAQYIIDSTGRASDLYRRIIARVETTPNFIFPEYAVQVSGNNAVIEKNFYVTENCWSTDGKGNYTTCANNGDAN